MSEELFAQFSEVFAQFSDVFAQFLAGVGWRRHGDGI